MSFSSKRLNDMEGFYARLMKIISSPSSGIHEFDFPKDIIRNDEDMKFQRNRKSYWQTYQDMVQEIKEKDPAYNPFPNCQDIAKIVRTVLGHFLAIYDMLNEKLGYGKKFKLTIIQEKEDKLSKRRKGGRKEKGKNPHLPAPVKKRKENNKLVL